MVERHAQRCECGGFLDTQICAPRVHTWNSDWYYMNSKEKVFIESKRQLFAECKKRGKYSVGYDQENHFDDPGPQAGDLKTRDEVVNQEAAFVDKCPEE